MEALLAPLAGAQRRALDTLTNPSLRKCLRLLVCMRAFMRSFRECVRARVCVYCVLRVCARMHALVLRVYVGVYVRAGALLTHIVNAHVCSFAGARSCVCVVPAPLFAHTFAMHSF